MDGPNHELNFQRHILTRHNTSEITSYLRFNKGDDSYLGHLTYYLPILEGTDVYEEFLSDYEELKDKEITHKGTGRPLKEEVSVDTTETPTVVGEGTVVDTPEVESEEAEETSDEKLSEKDFRALSASDQKALVTPTEDNDGSNADERVALYLS